MKLLMILVCKGTCAPVAPPFQRAGGSVLVTHPRSGVRGSIYNMRKSLAMNFNVIKSHVNTLNVRWGSASPAYPTCVHAW